MTMTNSYEEMKTLAQETNKEIAKLKSELAAKAKVAFHKECEEFFKENQKIATFGWRQFEPWNDGEETSFEVFVDYEDVFVNGVSYFNIEETKAAEKLKPLYEAVSAFLSKCPHETFKQCFGNGSEITVDRTGVSIEEYEDG